MITYRQREAQPHELDSIRMRDGDRAVREGIPKYNVLRRRRNINRENIYANGDNYEDRGARLNACRCQYNSIRTGREFSASRGAWRRGLECSIHRDNRNRMDADIGYASR